jgi:phage anti-repressor protein
MKKKDNDDFFKILLSETTVDKEFLEDFYQKFKPGDDLDFSIKDEDVAKWLGVTVDTIREKLNNKYQNKISKSHSTELNAKIYLEKIDFMISSSSQQKLKNAKTYYLNYKAFKRLAMSSQTHKGEIVRHYFLQIEECLLEHQTVFKQAIDKKNDLKDLNRIIRNRRIKDGETSPGFIYVFLSDERYPGVFKTGRTVDIISRLATYNTGRINEIDLKYLAVVNDPVAIEKCMKMKLDKYRYLDRKELFKVNIDILKDIIKTCVCKTEKELNNFQEDIHGMIKYLEDKKAIKPFIVINEYGII